MQITLIIHQHLESCMIPPNCSIIIEGRQCGLTSTCVISVATDDEEYMIGTLCDDHFVDFKSQIKYMQEIGKLPKGNVRFQMIKPVGTDCILNSKNCP